MFSPIEKQTDVYYHRQLVVVEALQIEVIQQQQSFSWLHLYQPNKYRVIFAPIILRKSPLAVLFILHLQRHILIILLQIFMHLIQALNAPLSSLYILKGEHSK